MSYDTSDKHSLQLTDEQTLTAARSLPEAHLAALEAEGYHCQREHLFDVLLGARASGQTIEATCRELDRALERKYGCPRQIVAPAVPIP